jgi:hypothetical protein
MWLEAQVTTVALGPLVELSSARPAVPIRGTAGST